jgi:carbonic anhydrase
MNKLSKTTLIILILFLFPIFIKPTTIQANDKSPALPWGYEGGTDPSHWGEIEKDHDEHLMCREGVRQSPININHVPGFKLEKLHQHYFKTPVNIINNGHTILLKYGPGSFVEWGNEKFEIIQIHFHHPSEHLVNGETYPMEIHLVHKTPDHQYVVVAVFAKIGTQNPTIQKLWSLIPTEIDKEYTYKNEFLLANDFLPASKEYFYYNGSLTTPPCTENVTWFVLEQPIEISQEQVKNFQKFIDHNARPTQKINHRIVVKLK